MSDSARELLIVGAGPAGLATAIAAKQAGLDYQVIEKGTLVQAICNFPRNQIFFTTPELLEIGGLPFVTPYEKPTRLEALRYYRRVVEHYGLNVTLGEEVLGIRPATVGFQIETKSRAGVASTRRAIRVAIACGYYDHPNRLGVPGEDLPHVSHYYAEPYQHYRQRVVVVGGKNSAALAALDLYRNGAEVTLVHRRETLSDSIKYWIRPDIENRIKEGAIAARFETRVVAIGVSSVDLEGPGGIATLPAETVYLLTGYHPDDALLRRAGVHVDPETFVPEHDPKTFETNVPGLFVVGSMVSGKMTNKVFIENGRFHGDAIVAAISKAGARRP